MDVRHRIAGLYDYAVWCTVKARRVKPDDLLTADEYRQCAAECRAEARKLESQPR